MKQRCSYKGNQNYERYGGRGIKVCNEWIVDYTIFRTWALKNGYQEGLSIERVDNSKGYSPDNCTWIPVNHQSRNRRTSKLDIEKVRHIRKQYSTGKYKQNELAKMYSVTAPMIHVIVRNKKWVNA